MNTPLVRTNDPCTSHAAAASINADNLCERVWQIIFTYGPMISDEVRACLPGLSYSSVTARYKQLFLAGRIKYIGVRPGKSGRMQRIMIAI